MKKWYLAVLALALSVSTMSFAEAQEAYVSGGFEASGHIFAGSGWHRLSRSSTAAASVLGREVKGTVPGVLGAYSNAGTRANKTDEFMFFVDEVELDLAKTFGENVRFRTDLDFGSSSLNGGPRFANREAVAAAFDDVGVLVEQAYATANLGVGNGLEVLLGRFNAPIGFESNDVGENDTISRSILYRALRPQTLTGAKFYYAFSDMADLHLFVVNNSLVHDNPSDFTGVAGTFPSASDYPAAGFRLGFNWGEEGKESTFGFSSAYGNDHVDVKHGRTFLGDADWQLWLTESFALGGEGLYRQIDTNTAARKNSKYYAGLVNFHYDFSDVWDGTLRYAYSHDVNGQAEVISSWGQAAQSLTNGNGAGGSIDQQLHEIALAGNYTIADGAKLKLEGGFTQVMPGGGLAKEKIFGVAGGFAYAF